MIIYSQQLSVCICKANSLCTVVLCVCCFCIDLCMVYVCVKKKLNKRWFKKFYCVQLKKIYIKIKQEQKRMNKNVCICINYIHTQQQRQECLH